MKRAVLGGQCRYREVVSLRCQLGGFDFSSYIAADIVNKLSVVKGGSGTILWACGLNLFPGPSLRPEQGWRGCSLQCLHVVEG